MTNRRPPRRVVCIYMVVTGSSATRPLPRDGSVEELYGDPTDGKGWIRGKKWKKCPRWRA